MDDERQEELDCIAAIFPEIHFDSKHPFSASIELPVHPNGPVRVIFPASADGLLPTPPLLEILGQQGEQVTEPATNIESHDLLYLPSLQLRITLPEGYPEEKPPNFELATTPEWLSRAALDELQTNGDQMWERAGRSLVVYGYIDFLQQAAENAFGYAEKGKILEIPQDFKISLLDYDINAIQAAFEKETFDCGICLEPKKGSVCHRMIDCGHVFCVQCLQDFYNNAITEGDLASVRCLTPGCAKQRGEAQVTSGKYRKPKTQLSPSELLQMPLDHEIVNRYVKLRHKAELESDKNTIYCPRKWCQGAARSKKHKKLDGLEDTDISGDESEAENGKAKKFVAGRDLLAVCEDCSFAFCSRCYQGWHGEFFSCMPKTTTGELTEEDKASLEYMKMHTTPCPTCAAPAQKTHGCNHMICFKCSSHFCYLCSAWLSPSNPYKHYNEEKTGCYMRLWEQEEGDGEDVGIRFDAGPNHAGEVEIPDEQIAGEGGLLDAPVEIPADLPPPPIVDEVPQEPQEQFQREAPLVLRINQLPPQPPQPVPVVLEPDRRRHNHHRRQGPNNVPRDFRNIGRREPGGRGGPGGRGARQRQPRPAGRQAVGALDQNAADQEAQNQAWVQMFVHAALNDEEDQVAWGGEDEEDGAVWAIPVR